MATSGANLHILVQYTHRVHLYTLVFPPLSTLTHTNPLMYILHYFLFHFEEKQRIYSEILPGSFSLHYGHNKKGSFF